MKLLVACFVACITFAFVWGGCSSQPKAKEGDTVKVHYLGHLEDGTAFDSSRGGQPLEFTIGKGDIIAGFDKGVIGMVVGEKKTITIPADQAYGPRQEGMVMPVAKSQFPTDVELKPGLQLYTQSPGGRPMPITVVEVGDSTVTIDANHPLAGKTLIFDLELMEITPPAEATTK
jgi:peptidylprolyl isomerase